MDDLQIKVSLFASPEAELVELHAIQLPLGFQSFMNIHHLDHVLLGHLLDLFREL